MQNNDRNKMITTASNKGVEQEYFFAGGMEHHPVTVRATSHEEAEEIWKKVRRPVQQSADESPQGSEADVTSSSN